MDNKQKMFYGMPDQSMPKMPFYMAYPMQTVYLEELEYEKDMQKLKDLYPKEVRSIQTMVEDECDKMEYDGSLMFDEYPDRMMLDRIVKRIYDGVSVTKTEAVDFEAEQYELVNMRGQYGEEQNILGQYEAEQYENGMQAEELPLEGRLVAQRGGPDRNRNPDWGRRPGWEPGRNPSGKDNGLKNLIEVLLFNEMYQRRCRHRRCRRWWV